MQKRGQLTIRINALLRPAIGAAGVDPALAASGIKQNDGDEMLRVGGIKLAVDGGFEGGLMRDLVRKALGRERHVPRPADDRHRALRRRCPRAEPPGLARRDACGRGCRHRPGPQRLRKRQCRTIDRRSPLVDRARLHRAARSSAADEGAGRGRSLRRITSILRVRAS